jgi:Fe-S oxidoreductase
MSSQSQKNSIIELLEELADAFGSGRVLTDVEDLYVYSHDGAFGTRSHEFPVAILRLEDRNEERAFLGFVSRYGVQLVMDNWDENGRESDDGDRPILFVDTKSSINTDTLKERLSELRRCHLEGKLALKEPRPLPHWFVSSLKINDGYRISERAKVDKGFCVVQSYFDGIETYSSKGRLLLSKGLLSGELKVSERLVDSMFSCTACGQCYDQLGRGDLEINSAIIRARHEISKAGKGPGVCRVALRNILEEGNPMGMPAEDRIIWWEGLWKEHAFGGNDFLYWPGCTTAYRLPGVVEATASVFGEAGLDFGLLGNQKLCCGLVLYLNGQWDEAGENARKLCVGLREDGVRRLLTSCAGCYYMFTRVYPILGVQPPFSVLHTSQAMEGLIVRDRLNLKEVKGKFAWHDPCDLGRHSGVFDPPRNVLRAIPGLELEEPHLNREHTVCCGAGGGLWMYDSGLAERMARSKLEDDLLPLGVDGIVTGCPACILSLRDAMRTLQLDKEVLDLAEVVAYGL